MRTRSQEEINQVKKATSLNISVSISNNFSFLEKVGSFTKVWSTKKAQGFEQLNKYSEASVRIQHSQKVVKSTIKKLEAMGYSIELVESTEVMTDYFIHWVIIRK